MKASNATRSVLLALALVVLLPTAYAQTTPDTTAQTGAMVDTDDDDGDSGLWGLLGLIGLAGLIPRKHRVETHDTTRRT